MNPTSTTAAKLNESMGKRIAELRKGHHMTQEQLAEALGISVKHCSCVERGTATLSLERLLDVCDLFDVSLDFLVRGKSPETAEIPPSVAEAFRTGSIEERSLLTEYVSLYRDMKNFYSKDEKQLS